MESRKGIAAVAAALVIIGGGIALVAWGGEGSNVRAAEPAPSAPVAATIGGESLIPPQGAPPGTYKDWNEMARDYMVRNPGNQGLAKLVDALSLMPIQAVSALGAQKRVLEAVIADGWRAASPQLDAAVRAQSQALEAAFAAAQFAPFPMPPAVDFTSPVPNFLSTQMLVKIMLATARMAEAGGDVNGAAQRALATARLSESFCGRGTFLISHLIGVAGLQLSARTLASILRNPALSPQAAAGILSSLKDLESKRAGFAEAVRNDARCRIGGIRRLKGDPAAAASDPNTKAMVDSIKSLPEFERETDRVFQILAANYQKPAWQREKLDLQKISSDPTVTLGAQPNFDEAATRAECAMAWLRLCQALAATRAGKQAEAAQVRDPFADRAISAKADRFYSFGPDATDQNGLVPYDATNGTVSAGDIVALR